jgi:hypothetical protein
VSPFPKSDARPRGAENQTNFIIEKNGTVVKAKNGENL